MLEVIEKLLILQDRDRKIHRVSRELEGIGIERASLNTRITQAQAAMDATKLTARQIESDRKKLELEVDAKKSQIEKYSLQQFQTKKNEEYRALAHEIDNCKAAIVKLDDQQIELMERAEIAQKQADEASKVAAESKKHAEQLMSDLAARETNLKKELQELTSSREALASAVDEDTLYRYERLLQQKGDNCVVGISHSVCGGCHMKLPLQSVVTCQGQHELVTCPNCGRILYYTRDMQLNVVD